MMKRLGINAKDVIVEAAARVLEKGAPAEHCEFSFRVGVLFLLQQLDDMERDELHGGFVNETIRSRAFDLELVKRNYPL